MTRSPVVHRTQWVVLSGWAVNKCGKWEWYGDIDQSWLREVKLVDQDEGVATGRPVRRRMKKGSGGD